MNIAVVALGLIGGSLAKALKEKTGHFVYGYNRSPAVLDAALSEGAIDAPLLAEDFSKCDVFLIALYPDDTIAFVREHIGRFKKGAVIIDCAGVKSRICAELSPYTKAHGLRFVGGHPMAGIEKSGFAYSFAALFSGASMILCRSADTDEDALLVARELLLPLGFSSITVTTPEIHDRTIAFTSQLAHLVSNAYVKSETASNQQGFSAGSYKDMTRVAYLNAGMWSQLFFENKDYLLSEVTSLIARLQEYVFALEQGDEACMLQLLEDGVRKKVQRG